MVYKSEQLDNELIKMLKSGDSDAYTEIYDRYKLLLFNHAYKKLGDADAAQDVLQDVFLNLWNRRGQLSESENLGGYLYTSIRNKVFNIIAHAKVRNVYADSIYRFAQSEHRHADYLVRERQFSKLIEKEIDALPPRMREIFLLSRKEHLKNKEIADKLSLSEHTVATQIKRAIKILQVRLGPFMLLFTIYFKN